MKIIEDGEKCVLIGDHIFISVKYIKDFKNLPDHHSLRCVVKDITTELDGSKLIWMENFFENK